MGEYTHADAANSAVDLDDFVGTHESTIQCDLHWSCEDLRRFQALLAQFRIWASEKHLKSISR